MRGFALWGMFAAILFASEGLASCYDPMPPDPPILGVQPTKPVPPICVDSNNRTDTCEQWEIDSYRAELAQYQADVEVSIQKLRGYVSDARRVAVKVLEYARCEAANLK